MSAPEICDYCGKDCGNAGAATQHEGACDENPANQGEQARPPDRRQPRAQEAQPPARRDEQQGPGESVGEMLVTLTSDEADMRDQGRAIAQGAGLIGQIFQGYQNARFRNRERRKEVAKAATLEKVQEYPDCPDCGYTFDPEQAGVEGGQVRCPECKSLLNVVVESPESADTIDA